MTPEGKIKAKVKKLLAAHDDLWAHWPVQTGYGAPTLDCTGSSRGRAFAIETKAPGKKLTPRQELTVENMHLGGVKVFVIDSEESMVPLFLWLQ